MADASETASSGNGSADLGGVESEFAPTSDSSAAAPSAAPSGPLGPLGEPSTSPATTPSAPSGAFPAIGASAEAEPPLDIAQELEKLLEKEAGPRQPRHEEELTKLLEGLQQGTPAYERIRTLANARREAQETTTAAQREIQQLRNYIPQLQEYTQKLQQHYQFEMQRQMQMLQAQIAERDQRLASLMEQMQPARPEDALKKDWLGSMEGLLTAREKALRESEVRPLAQRLAAIEQQREVESTQQLSRQLQEQATQAVRQIVLQGIMEHFDKDTLAVIEPGLAAEALALQMHTQCTIAEAAAQVRRNHLFISSALTKAVTAAAKSSAKKAKEPNAASTSRRSTGTGSPIPSEEELAKRGTDALGWQVEQALRE
jgi:hypothetical protein